MSTDKTNVTIEKNVFNRAYIPFLSEMTRTQIYYGGSGSGKSVFLAERTVIDVMRGGRNYLIARAVGRTLRRSVFNEIVKIIDAWGVSKLFDVTESLLTITCQNKYQILFTGLDDTEKIKSITPKKGVITDVWVEEATEADRSAIKQLYKRQRGGDPKTPKRLSLSFNPILQLHWIYEEYFKSIGWAEGQTVHHGDELSILKTTYQDNRFLTDSDRRDLEKETDPYYYNVYTLGNWGVLGNVIFTNWRVQDLSGMLDQFTNPRNGLDFGFADDPAAGLFSHYDSKKKEIYVYDEFYETALTNDLLAALVLERAKNQPIVCDSSEPKSIAEMRRSGVNALAAKKGPDSVTFGIDWLKQQTIIIDVRCINLRNELQSYKWREDAGGNVSHRNGRPVPVDRANHLIDALRYAYEMDMGESDWLMF